MTRSKVSKPSLQDNGKVEHVPFNTNTVAPVEATADSTPKPAPDTAGLDPFDPNTYKVRQSLAAAAGVKNVLTDLPVRTPDKSWWVRRHPSPDYALHTFVIELREEREDYLVLPPLWPSLYGEACFRAKSFYLAMNRQGKLFIWGVRRPADDTEEPDKWMVGPQKAVHLAADKWVRIYWANSSLGHVVRTSEVDEEPEWPDLPFKDLLRLGFKDKVIDSLDHPVPKRLRGESR
jgi:hypothetical protein